MAKRSGLKLSEIWYDVLRKGLPFIIIAALGSIGKASYDVYAFSQTKNALVAKINKHELSIGTMGIQLRGKANQSEMVSIHTKVNRILTILCTMSENKPIDCIGN